MTARARQFACTTDNKRACACQNRWRCVTVSTQCCLLLAWPSTPCHVSFHNQAEGKMGRRNQPAFLPVSFCCCLFGINLIPMPLVMPFPSHFPFFFSLFCSGLLAVCLLSLSPHSLTCLCCGMKALKFKEWLISLCLLFQDNIFFFLFQTEIMSSFFFCFDRISARKWAYYFWMLSCLFFLFVSVCFELIDLKKLSRKIKKKKREERSLFIRRLKVIRFKARPVGTHHWFHLIKNHQMFNKIAARRGCHGFFLIIHPVSHLSWKQYLLSTTW